MKKTTILIITALSLLGGTYLFFLFYPSLVWYYVFDHKERQFTALSGKQLEQALSERARQTVQRINQGEKPGKELSYLKENEHLISPEERARKQEYLQRIAAGEAPDPAGPDPDAPEIELLTEFYRERYLQNRKIKRTVLFKTQNYYAYFPRTTLTLRALIHDPQAYTDPKELDNKIKLLLVRKLNQVGSIRNITGSGSIYTVEFEDVRQDIDLSALFGPGGKLDFKLVSPENERLIGELLLAVDKQGGPLFDEKGLLKPQYQERLPGGTLCLELSDFFSRKENQKYPFLIVEDTQLFPQGFMIKEAAVAPTSMGQNVVQFELDEKGARRFEEITRDNIGRQLAVIVDGRVITAPVIQEKISGGKSQITLGKIETEKLFILATILKTENQDISFEFIAVR